MNRKLATIDDSETMAWQTGMILEEPDCTAVFALFVSSLCCLTVAENMDIDKWKTCWTTWYSGKLWSTKEIYIL